MSGRRSSHVAKRDTGWAVKERTRNAIAKNQIISPPWSTWSAVISLTSRAGELRSAPSGPDDRDRVAGKRALALGVRGRRALTRLRGMVPCTGLPLNCRTHPLPRPWGGVRVRRAITRVSEGWFCAPGFPQRRNFSLALWAPLAAERPLYSEL